jgi:hypothetical protein
MVVDTGLVKLGRIDAIEPVSDIAELDGAAIVDDGLGRKRGVSEEDGSEKGENRKKTHVLWSRFKQMDARSLAHSDASAIVRQS